MSEDDPLENLDLWWDWGEKPSPFHGIFELSLREERRPDVNDHALRAWADESGDEHLRDLAQDPEPSPARKSCLHRFWHDGRLTPPAWRHDFGAAEPLRWSLRVKSDGSWWVSNHAEYQFSGRLDLEPLPGVPEGWVRAAALHPWLLIDQMAAETVESIDRGGRPAVERRGKPARDDIPYDDPWPPGDECRLVVDEETGVLLALSVSYHGDLVTTLETTFIEVNSAIDNSVFKPETS